MAQGESNTQSHAEVTAKTGPLQAVPVPDRETAESDEELARQALEGRDGAFDALVLRYQDRVFNTLVHLTGSQDDAPDLAQETFLKAYRALGSFRHGSKFYTWLFRIAVNTALSRRRQDARRRGREGVRLDAPPDERRQEDAQPLRDGLAGPEDSDPAERLEKKLIRKRVREALEQVDADYRDVLVLRDIDGLDYDAIAEALDLTRAAVKSRLHRARQEMARLLKDLRE